MRGSKIIPIDNGREITVKEISPKMALDLFRNDEQEGRQGFDMSALDSLCREGCGLSVEELSCLYGSELEKVWDGFKEVNGFFFRTAAMFGLDRIPERIGEVIAGIYNSELAGLLNSDTSTPPTTAGHSST